MAVDELLTRVSMINVCSLKVSQLSISLVM